jgi:hypothetical protein
VQPRMDEESSILRESYACFQITVENRDYHHLSQCEIDGFGVASRRLSLIYFPTRCPPSSKR